MHVVHILTRLLRAGSEENILLTSAGQIADGDEVTLLYGGHSKTNLAERMAPEARLVEVPSLVRPVHPFRDFQALAGIYRALRALSPDVVHTHQSKAGIVGRFAAATAEVPCVVHGVHILPFLGVGAAKRAFYLQAERAAARVTHGYVHVSEGMMHACLENGIGLNVPHEIVFSGFDLERFRRADACTDARELIGSVPGGEPPVILSMLAALEPRKQHLGLLDALTPVLRDRPETRVLLAGEGRLQSEIAARVRELGLSEQVRLLGYREDPERVIAMSDICLLSSGQEGLPRSVLQYVAGGRPVVMFDLPGIDVVAQHDRNALVLPTDDWTAYGKAVARLIDNPALRARLAGGSRAVDLSPWDWRGMGEKTTRFYRLIMGERAFQKA